MDERPKRIQWDGTISLNTIVMMLTIFAALTSATDKIADARADAAVIKAQVLILKEADLAIQQAQRADRAEIRAEMGEISKKLDRLLEGRMGSR